ncbi:MAG: hypothetical protein IJK02_09595 [Clostridia bacterium]|nr:hypothetical protein [Clostridia bacterium]MBR0509257.1 hypothetical protein [Clostridia bacterium]MBR0537688.1 hypothetical protein [Clostridia bacterium]
MLYTVLTALGCLGLGVLEFVLDVKLFNAVFASRLPYALAVFGIKAAVYAAMLWTMIVPLRAYVIAGAIGYGVGFTVSLTVYGVRRVLSQKEV